MSVELDTSNPTADDEGSAGAYQYESEHDADSSSLSVNKSPHSPQSSSSSAYKHLRVRYIALRKALRRQEGDIERIAAVHAQTVADAQSASEERKKEQRALQQLVGQIGQLQEDNTRLRRREEQWEEREQQHLVQQREVQSQLAACRDECGRTQAELDRQCESLASERRRLVATVSRHITDLNHQQRTVQALTQTVDELTAEIASREAEREELLSDMQALRDAVQILQAHTQQQHTHRHDTAASATAGRAKSLALTDGTPEPSTEAATMLFLSPLYVASPCIDSTPSTSTCDVLRFSSQQSAHSDSAAVSRAGGLSSPLDAQLLHADTIASLSTTSSPRSNGSSGRAAVRLSTASTNTSSVTPPSDSATAASTSAASSVSASSSLSSLPTTSPMFPVSPFSAEDFPPLPSSPNTAPPVTRTSVWSGKRTQRPASQRNNDTVTVKQQQHNDATAAATDAQVSGEEAGTIDSVDSIALSTARFLHFHTVDESAEDDTTADQKLPPSAAAAQVGHTCSSTCSFCQQAAPPLSIIPNTFDTPAGDRRVSHHRHTGESRRSDEDALPSAVSSSSSPCSSCQLRVTSALLTPVSSSHRSLAVLDSEFRRVKRWTAQLQHQISKQQHQHRQDDNEQHSSLEQTRAHSLASPATPTSATQPTLLSPPHPSQPRPRANSEPPHEADYTLYAATLSAAPSANLTMAVDAAAQPSSPLSSAPPHSVSVSSLLVQLSLCEAELRAKDIGLQAAVQHIAALHDKLSVMADSVEQLEASVDEQSQLHSEQRRRAEETDTERQTLSAAVQAAEQHAAELVEQCAALQQQLDEVREQTACEQSQYSQHRAEWEQRCSALVSQVALLEASAQLHTEQHSRLLAELEAYEELKRASQVDTRDAKANKCSCADELADEQKELRVMNTGSTSHTADTAPALLKLVEQQLWEEIRELQELSSLW